MSSKSEDIKTVSSPASKGQGVILKDLRIVVQRLSEEVIAKATGQSSGIAPDADAGSCNNSGSRKRKSNTSEFNNAACHPNATHTFRIKQTRTVHTTRRHPRVIISEVAGKFSAPAPNKGDPDFLQNLSSSRGLSPGKESTTTIDSRPQSNPVALRARKEYSRLRKRPTAVQSEDRRASTTDACEICERTFQNQHSLRAHIVAAHRKRFACSTCGKKFGSRLDFRRHLIRRHIGEKFECCRCRQIFPSYPSLAEHRTEAHKLENKLKHICQECGMVCKDALALKRHEVCHLDEIHVCPVCDKGFPRVTEMMLHKMTHSVERFSCASCPKLYLYKSSLNRHIRESHPEDVPSKGYGECGGGLKNEHELEGRERSHHSYQKYECEICEERFQSSSLLAEHLGKREEEEEIQCR